MSQPARAAAEVATPSGTGSVEVVALVTSAGGLEALTRVLADLPADFGAAVVVAQHLGGQGSKLVEILDRRIALPVDWARDGARIEPGRVTVCQPRAMLEVLPDRTCSIRPIESRLADRPLDVLLTSIGDTFGAAALAVVLTGMGDDSAAGAAAVRSAGGVVVAQSEDTAEHPAMPRAADRKSTRLNSSHANISYAVFCLKKKKKNLRLDSERGQSSLTNSGKKSSCQ